MTHPYIFKSLEIYNFVSHKQTYITLEDTPITLITGANGTGKSLILDALLIAMGSGSDRVRKQKLTSFIGPFDNYFKITLNLNNPRVYGRRILRSIEPTLSDLLDKDIVSISVTVNKRGVRQYTINGRRTIGNVPINMAHIRNIFKNANISPDAPLFVTEQGTINSFANLSPRRRFDVLLQSTNLKDYLNKLIATQLEVKNELRDIQPLITKMQEEERKLNILKNAYEAFVQRKKLEERKQKLQIEFAWATVNDLEILKEELSKQKKEVEEKLEKVNEKLIELNNHLSWKESQIITKRELLENLQNDLQESLKKRYQLEERQRILQEEITQYAQITNGGTIEAIDREKKLEEEIKRLEEKLKRLKMDKERIAEELQQLEKQEASEVIEQEMSNYEYNKLLACSEFKELVKKEHLENRIIGPIISEIRVKKDEEMWEPVIKSALWRYLFSFLALDEDSFRKIKQAYDRLERKIDVDVFLYNGHKTNREPPPEKRLYDWVVNLIGGRKEVLNFLTQVINTIAAFEGGDPVDMAKLTNKYKADIITENCKSHYARGGFKKPYSPTRLKLGIDYSEDLHREEGDYRKQYRELSRESKEIHQEIVRVNREISKLQKRLIIIRTSRVESTSLEDFEIEAKAIEVERINEELQKIEEEIKQIKNAIENIKTELEKAEEELSKLKDKLSREEEKKKQLKEQIERFTQQEQQLETQILEEIDRANNIGERPQKIRDKDVIREEIAKVEGMLETIKVTIDDEQAYFRQKEKVERLRKYFNDRQAHVENLKADLTQRLDEWRALITQIVSKINTLIKLLLKPRYDDVRIVLTNIDTPEEIELHIESKVEKNSNWRSFGHLSGGEEVLLTQAFILALHSLTRSPIHIIDEFTQRLDASNKAFVLSMVLKAGKIMESQTNGIGVQFILIAPMITGIHLPEEVTHIALIKTKEGRFWRTRQIAQ